MVVTVAYRDPETFEHHATIKTIQRTNEFNF